MANLDRDFQVTGTVGNRREEVEKAVRSLEGVNHVRIAPGGDRITVGYTPGITNVQLIKEAIESRGVDISDRGDD